MAKQLNAGALRHKIDFLQRNDKPENNNGRDEFGQPLNTKTTTVTSNWILFKKGIYASVEPVLGNQFFASLTSDTKVEVKFNCRYISGIKDTMRIQFGNDVYEILSVINVQEINKELVLYARKVKVS